jgi:hypothetical protein
MPVDATPETGPQPEPPADPSADPADPLADPSDSPTAPADPSDPTAAPPVAPPRIVAGHGSGALAGAITRAWRPYRWRGYLLGLVAGILAGGILGPLLTVALAFGLGLAGVTIDPLTPWAEIIWSGVFAVTFAAAGAWAVARWLPRDFRAATETYLWLAVRAEAHWHERFGDAAVPRSKSAMQTFIEATPETPETGGERFGIWMALGDLASARRVIEQMPNDTASAHHARASAGWLVDLAAGTAGDLAALRSTAAELEDADERLEAEVELAVNAARVEVAAGRDWKPPLLAIRERLGTEPAAMLWQHTWPPAFRGMFVAAVVGVAAFWFFLPAS